MILARVGPQEKLARLEQGQPALLALQVALDLREAGQPALQVARVPRGLRAREVR